MKRALRDRKKPYETVLEARRRLEFVLKPSFLSFIKTLHQLISPSYSFFFRE